MKNNLTLTITAPDQKALLATLSHIISDHHGNWLESNIAQLAGRMAGIVRIAIQDQHRPALEAALQGINSEETKIYLSHTEHDLPKTTPIVPLLLQLTGNDRSGIVRDITRIIAQAGGSIEKLETSCEAAPHTSEQLFIAKVRLLLPTTTPGGVLQEQLEALEDELMVDITPIKAPASQGAPQPA